VGRGKWKKCGQLPSLVAVDVWPYVPTASQPDADADAKSDTEPALLGITCGQREASMAFGSVADGPQFAPATGDGRQLTV